LFSLADTISSLLVELSTNSVSVFSPSEYVFEELFSSVVVTPAIVYEVVSTPVEDNVLNTILSLAFNSADLFLPTKDQVPESLVAFVTDAVNPVPEKSIVYDKVLDQVPSFSKVIEALLTKPVEMFDPLGSSSLTVKIVPLIVTVVVDVPLLSIDVETSLKDDIVQSPDNLFAFVLAQEDKVADTIKMLNK
tara:strand:- start:3460 stop:4032 length:573 start_codon:yes stop_codon:yes gene_type:complete